MKNEKNTLNAIGAEKLKIGEQILFDRVIKQYVDTRFGTSTIVKFSKDNKVIRSTFAGNGLLQFLKENPEAKSITLVDKIQDGDMTYNVYE